MQQLCHELAEELRSTGDSAVLIGAGSSRNHGGPGWDDGTIPAGRSFKVRANRSGVPLTMSPGAWPRLSRSLVDVDVVHVHEPFVPIIGWAAMGSKKPMVVTFHADPPSWVERAYQMLPFVGRRMRSAVLTAVSSAARDPIPKSWGPVRIVPNAVNISAYDLPVGRVDRRIAFLGRDDPRKGLDIALQAFSEVRQEHPEAELVVMGAHREKAAAGVRYMGRVSDGEKQRMLASSAIYIAPNTGGESFGIVIAEAMAAGCAIVASDIAPFREVVEESGVFFPVGDSAALAGEISSLLSDKPRLEMLGASARKAVARFDWSNVLGIYRDAYAAVLADR